MGNISQLETKVVFSPFDDKSSINYIYEGEREEVCVCMER